MSILINSTVKAQRAQLDELVQQLHELIIRIGNDELARTVSDLRNRLHEPFMFVIVGEVKAGKSSFVNALLATGKEVTKVAPQPMTDTIQQILYGEEHTEVMVNDYLKKIFLPVDILREVAIVDTPGTNTIISHHQEITERFVPASDLIIFVFEAKNPYRQSAWDFFDYIQGEWRKKVVFVLQQKDLLPAEDLAINEQGVRDHAFKKGITEPQVFSVSAKLEQEGDTEHSGYLPLRQYVSGHITGGRAPLLKLRNSADLTRNIHDRIEQGLDLRRRQLAADTVFREEVKQTLDEQETKSQKQVDLLLDALMGAYDRVTTRYEQELAGGLSVFGLFKRSVSSMFTKTPSAVDWLKGMATDMEKELNQALEQRLSTGMVDLATSIQQMAKMIDLKIRSSETILKNDHELFSDIAERRENVLRDLKEQFSQFLVRNENFTDENLFPDKGALTPKVAAGSGIAAVGIVMMALGTVGALDITGGLLTTVGLLFAGFSTRSQRRQVLEGFREEVNKSRDLLSNRVSNDLGQYIRHLKSKIDGNFLRFDEHLRKEQQQLAELDAVHQSIDERLTALEAELAK